MPSLERDAEFQNIARRLGSLTPESKARWGKMSVHQMVCHLCDSFRFALELKPASPATGLLQRTAMKWFALYVPIHWPKGVPTRPEMEQGKGGSAPVEFASDLKELAELIGAFAGRRSFGVAHPIFGTMTTGEWLRWGYLHTDHHLRQFGV